MVLMSLDRCERRGGDLVVLKLPLKNYVLFACHAITIQAKLGQTIREPIEGSEQSFVSMNGADSFGAIILKFEIRLKSFEIKLLKFQLKSLTIFEIQSHRKF